MKVKDLISSLQMLHSEDEINIEANNIVYTLNGLTMYVTGKENKVLISLKDEVK